uniref:Uncharacterized protein n=1 Tax=Panagrolaimus davidi TaxID=227884 RepID=A0A914PFP0_9BILA
MKRRNPFDDEEEEDSSVEEHSRRSNFFENLVKNENLVLDVMSTSTSTDYTKLNERYADLEVKYGQAMSQIAIFEQTAYENELFVNRITEDRDSAIKRADEAEAEKERAQKKAADIELLNKDLGNDVIEFQSIIAQMKKDKLDLEERINGLQNELQNERKNFETEKSLFNDERKVASERIISLQKELTDLENAAEEKSNEENSKLFAKIDNLKNQLKQERISAIQERENCMNEYESIEAAHKRMITEKEGLQKQLENLQESSNAKIAELNRITEDRDSAIKRADEAEAEKERAQKKAADIELLNKDLGNDVIKFQSIIAQMKKYKLDLEERINGLQNELQNEKENLETEKFFFADERKVANERIINLQKELTDLKNAAEEKSNEENSKLFAKIDNLENQLEQEKISAVQERENYMNEYESIEAAHKRMITEKEGLQKQLENLQESSNAKIAELEESVINRAKEMFNEWKKEKSIKKKKRQAESSDFKETAVKNEDYEMKDDEMQNQNEPRWMFVSKAECLDIYNSNHDKIKNFLQQYYSRLFNHVELMLPEEKMNKEKLAEAQAVVLWFWRPENDAQKELVITAAKKKLNERRSAARAQAYKYCTNDRSVAFTSDGKEFYYSLRKCGTWKPVADKECKRIKKFRRTHHSSFGIPSEYASSEYILIVQDCPEEGQKIHKMLPSGYIECIFKKAGHEKKSPKQKE